MMPPIPINGWASGPTGHSQPGLFCSLRWGLLSILLLLCLGWSGAGWAAGFPGKLVEPMWLYRHLHEVVVLDVRDDADSFHSRRKTTSQKVFNPCGVSASADANAPVFGHIPGAVSVPWQEVMVDRQMGGESLQQMLPEPTAFQALMQRAGVNDDSLVVIAGRGMNGGQMAMATRLYWTLKYYGHPHIALLDGGTAAWIAKGRRVRFYQSTPQPGNFTIKREHTELLSTTQQMVQWSQDRSQQLVDVRSPDYFEGLARVEKYVASSGEGHIPNSLNLPVSLLLADKSPATFRHGMEILAQADKHQVSTKAPTVFYCNVGLQGSLAWFIWSELLHNEGTRLYDGSMHAWSRDPNRKSIGF